MSKENLEKLIELARTDQELRQAWRETENYDQVKDLARSKGLDLGDLSAPDARKIMAGNASAQAPANLTDTDLDNVVAGANPTKGSVSKEGAASRDSSFSVEEVKGIASKGTQKPGCTICCCNTDFFH